MDISSVSTGMMAMATASQQLQGTMEVQMTVLRELAASQQQIAQMLAESGLGHQVDVRV